MTVGENSFSTQKDTPNRGMAPTKTSLFLKVRMLNIVRMDNDTILRGTILVMR